MFSEIEFESLANDENLMAVVMQLVVTQIVQLFCGMRDKQFLLVIDEAWRVMKQFSPFLNRFVRTFRKYGGSQFIVTQGYEEFQANDDTKTVWKNSAWKIFLQQSEDIPSLSDNENKLLRSLKTIKGQYSELLIKSAGSVVVMRCALDKKSLVLYATDQVLFKKIKELEARGMSMLDATKQCMEEL